MSHFRVFLGAPSGKDVNRDVSSYRWQTVRSTAPSTPSASIAYPIATLEAASRRISLLYQNIIFDQDEDNEQYDNFDSGETRHDQTANMTTNITWPATASDALVPPQSEIQPDAQPLKPSLQELKSIVSFQPPFGTFETQGTTSYGYSDASSIARFPSFQFSLHTLVSLPSLVQSASKGFGQFRQKVCVLLAILEVEGPDTITIKRGKDAGKEVSIMKLILGDENSTVCKLTAWRETADSFACLDPMRASLKRGDIVYFENVQVTSEPGSTLSFTASPHLKSRAEICYRTMPYDSSDARLRPDLRLGISDASVRKVAAVVTWFEGMAGLL